MTSEFKITIIELKPSDISGIGVFAVRDISENQVVAEGIHDEDYQTIIPWPEMFDLDIDTKQRILAYCIGTPKGFFPPPDNDFSQLTVGWYMNHSCQGNIGFNEDGDFIAIDNIKSGDELTYDYGLAESNPDFSMICNCKSNCRQLISGNDWKNEKFREENLEFMLPRLRIHPTGRSL